VVKIMNNLNVCSAHSFLFPRSRLNIFIIIRKSKRHIEGKNHIFSNCGGRREKCWGILCEKSRLYTKKSYFFQF
jgi:hypothetical protein